MSLTILCVTKGEDYANPFLEHFIEVSKELGTKLVIAVDSDAVSELRSADVHWIPVNSKGYIESVLDEAVAACKTDYIFRIDDDERFSPALVRWLKAGEYRKADHWKFPRVHFWEDTNHYIAAAPLWPDHQTRLSKKEMSGGRPWIHSGSPFGGGELCDHPIEHHKFLVKSFVERKAIAERYESVLPGSGSGVMTAFSLPEVAYSGHVPSVRYIDSDLVDRALEVAKSVGMHQHEGEIREFARWLTTRNLQNVLEIGTLKGGTAALWHELSSGTVVSIDLPNGRWGGADHGFTEEAAQRRNEELTKRFPRFRGVLGDSHEGDTVHKAVSALNGQFVDLLFIDGDHSFDGVKKDFEMYRQIVRLGGVIAFHDVLNSQFHHAVGCYVHQFWATLPPHKAEIINGDGQWGGIGVTFR